MIKLIINFFSLKFTFYYFLIREKHRELMYHNLAFETL